MSVHKVEEPLQAVVLVDTKSTALRVFNDSGISEAFVDVCGAPALALTLAFLEGNAVREALVVSTGNHCSQIKEYIAHSKFAHSKMHVGVVSLPDALSACDALRAVSNMNVIRSDPFILTFCGVVASLDLKEVISNHKARVKADPRNILTLCFSKSLWNQSSRTLIDDKILALAKPENEIKDSGNDLELIGYIDARLQKRLSVDARILAGGGTGPALFPHQNVEMRYDLKDSFVDICSPALLHLIGDEFDWRSLREDVLEEILASDVLGYRVFAHVQENRFSARISCPRSYDALCRDLIRRWTYPMVLESTIIFEWKSYQYSRKNIYKAESVHVSRSASIGSNCVIGRGSSIGDNCTIVDSVIGKNCIIGNNVKITGSYLWSNVLIEDDVVIDRSIICSECVVLHGAMVSKGSILCAEVRIGNGHSTPAFSRITSHKIERDNDSDFGSPRPGDQAIVDDLACGKEGKGFMYTDNSFGPAVLGMTLSEIQEQDFDLDKIYQLISLCSHEVDPREIELDSHILDPHAFEEKDVASDGEDPSPTRQRSFYFDFEGFFHEVFQTIQRHQQDGFRDESTIHLEVSTLKHSHHATLRDYAAAILLSIFSLVYTGGDKVSDVSKELKSDLSRVQKSWHFLLRKFISVDEEEKEQQSTELQFLHGLEKACMEFDRKFFAFFVQALQWLYVDDVVTGPSILKWASLAENDSNLQPLHSASKAFVQAVEEQEENDDDDEDEEDE